MRREKEGLTLSYIKMSSGRRSGDWGRKHPLSLCDAVPGCPCAEAEYRCAGKTNNERLEGVLIRWLLLKNNVMQRRQPGPRPKNNYLIKGDYHANMSYLSLSGETQGLISAGCQRLILSETKHSQNIKIRSWLCVNAFHLKKSKCQSS